jgi:hypothetical protein
MTDIEHPTSNVEWERFSYTFWDLVIMSLRGAWRRSNLIIYENIEIAALPSVARND